MGHTADLKGRRATVTGAFAHVLLVAFSGLISLILVMLPSITTVESAPLVSSLQRRSYRSPPKWLNPCGFAAEEFEGEIEVVQLNDVTLLSNVIMQAKNALSYARSFRETYVKRTFNTDLADLHATWKDNHYGWLPGPKQIPKQLGEHLDPEFRDKLEIRMIDTALLDAYEYMQRYAVGLEQIAWDQEDHHHEFWKQFKNTEYNLRSVLCELQMALAERSVAQREDVSRDVMSDEYRDMSDATFRNLRDWIIFRDYMNGLEYVVEVFEHLISIIKS
ncbi:uncharacterized protein LOC106638192 [Copidosoma floridanum]|uniref:uncharacterized protein LOC106638192 n=1 Tax=Copidosoma floridanum TaxID=29053 RepID=UPI0006C943F8|nr:uncharacterized protein LOC106638192 [Copidosoma floridanum]